MRVRRLVTGSSKGEILPYKAALRKADEDVRRIRTKLAVAGKLFLFTLALCAITLTVLLSVSLLTVPRWGVLVVGVLAIPGVLQLVDYFWPGHGLLWYEHSFAKLADRALGALLRRRRRAIFEAYGCEQRAESEFTEQQSSGAGLGSLAHQEAKKSAEDFMVASRVTRERKRGTLLRGFLAALVIASIGLWIIVSNRSYTLGQEFQMDSDWAVTVLSYPKCTIDDSGHNICHIGIRARNTARTTLSLYAGSFGSLGPSGPFLERQGDVDIYYYVALLDGDNYYSHTTLPESNGGQVYPGKTELLSLAFDAPPGIQPTEVRFRSLHAVSVDIVSF